MNIVLIVLVVVLASVVGYFVLKRGAAPSIQQATTPPPTTTQTPTPQAPVITSTDETKSWKSLKSNFGYTIKYPSTLKLINHCGGVNEPVPPIEKCENISINGNFFEDEYDNPNTESLVIRVLNTRGDTFDSFVNKVIATNYDVLTPENRKEFLLTKLIDQVASKKIGGKDAREFSFTGTLQTIPPYFGYSGGFEGYKGKTRALLVNLNTKEALLITYPLEFCKGTNAPYQCFSDNRISLYQAMLSSLSF